ncbi:hypothetical protein GCM10020000_54920 [Streptomyces olivoverticillatus]
MRWGALVTALREWFRKSELSADRAGLLAGQDLQASLRGLMKLAGGNHLHEMNVDAFLAQAEEYEKAGDLRDSVLKIMNMLPRSHPFAAVRAAELKKWSESRDYQRLMDGHYPRRTEDKDASVSDSFRESANHYAESVRSSKDPLMGLVRDIAGGANDLGGRLRDTFTGRGGRAEGGSEGGPAGRLSEALGGRHRCGGLGSAPGGQGAAQGCRGGRPWRTGRCRPGRCRRPSG